MKQTEHYQLIKWDPSDRVLRENFNDNNDKIDAALHKMAETPNLVKLKTFTVPRKIMGTSAFDMDVSDINWGEWQYIYVDFALKGRGHAFLYANSNQSDASSSGYVISSSDQSLTGHIPCSELGTEMLRGEFQIFCHGEQKLRTVCPYECIKGRSNNYTYNDLKTLHIKPKFEDYYLEPGSTITFWGVR